MKQLPILAMFLLAASAASADEAIVRKPWTESRIQGTPDPPRPYVAESVFEKQSGGITQGLEMVALDGRLFVMERSGKIWSFLENDPASELDLFIDLKAHDQDCNNAYGLVFHPNWKKNHQVFVSYTVRGKDPESGTRVSRFRFSPGSDSEPPRIDPDSEEIVFTWRASGHNGANLQFGPDGMLYISTGDATEPNPPDTLNTGQDNSDVLSCVLRIDVDHKDEGLSYRVPSDNPWVGKENVRPEIWAFGFRNPWKMSFDQKGRLWLGDVGWELWEMIFLVKRGGNYGWSAMENTNPIKPETASDLAPISLPVAAHRHTEAASMTGGYEYRGSRLPELRDAYVYGDYETGKIWALRHDGEKVTEHIEIADTPHKISTFGLGNDGELFYIHYGEPATIYRLAPNPRAGQPSDFPRKLSETGLFSDTAAQMPNDGVYEFAVYEPMWQDGAEATRYVALPEKSAIDTEALPRDKFTTTWPGDAVLAKTIRLGEKPVETQILYFDGDAWNGYSYGWNEAGTDAELVGAQGAEFDVFQRAWKGGPRYRISSRAECMRCHNMWNKFTPAFEPMQLAEFARFPGQPAREVAVGLGLANANFFHQNKNGNLVNSRKGGAVETRARSWLHANCAHCHRRHGGGSAPLEVNFERPVSESFTLWQTPTRGDFGLTDGRIILPGQPWRSVLNYRVSTIGNGHMPPLGSREVDPHGAKLLWDWIQKMPAEKPVQQGNATDLTGFSDTSSAIQLAHAIASGTLKGGERKKAVEAGLASANQNIRALFERFRSPADRPAPAELDPKRILTLEGNAERGAAILSPAGKLASCFACHKVGDIGGELGPDLSGVGARLKPEQLLESLTQPSRTIAPEFQIQVLETKSGELYSGFIAEENAETVTLKSPGGDTQKIPAGDITSRKAVPVSFMPDGLLNLVTEQEAADLLAYLQDLKRP